jgi:hypothetical protein
MDAYKLGKKNDFDICQDCWRKTFYELGGTRDVLDSLLHDMGITIEELPEDMREVFEQHIVEQEAERQYEAELNK